MEDRLWQRLAEYGITTVDELIKAIQELPVINIGPFVTDIFLSEDDDERQHSNA